MKNKTDGGVGHPPPAEVDMEVQKNARLLAQVLRQSNSAGGLFSIRFRGWPFIKPVRRITDDGQTLH
jgi:hypothetical protein